MHDVKHRCIMFYTKGNPPCDDQDWVLMIDLTDI